MHYKHLSCEERTMIQLSLEQGCRLRAIARSLHRAPSSISRELKRNGWSNPAMAPKKRGRPMVAGGYRAPLAQQRADGVSLPDEIKRREDRLAGIAAEKAKIEARANERYEQEQAEYAAKLAARAEKEAATGKKPGGKPPTPPESGPRADDQINLTDEESRIMKVAGGGFEQCYNAQAVVDTESMLILIPHVTQATNDKEQIEPMLMPLPGLIFSASAGFARMKSMVMAGHFRLTTGPCVTVTLPALSPKRPRL